jgi:hypothetical protein
MFLYVRYQLFFDNTVKSNLTEVYFFLDKIKTWWTKGKNYYIKIYSNIYIKIFILMNPTAWKPYTHLKIKSFSDYLHLFIKPLVFHTTHYAMHSCRFPKTTYITHDKVVKLTRCCKIWGFHGSVSVSLECSFLICCAMQSCGHIPTSYRNVLSPS